MSQGKRTYRRGGRAVRKTYTLVVVPETHWDREWRSAFQQFRRRLVKLTDLLVSLLESDRNFPAFTMDGQTVVLEDVLEIRPQLREKLRTFVSRGRIVVGPWYVLADEFLVSGEALVRNLMLGHKVARSFGRVMKVGYVPDPFGHVAQMPQILAGFGMDSAIFTRGVGAQKEGERTEFWWEAPDGTRVLAVHQIDGYCNLANWGRRHEGGRFVVDEEVALRQVQREIERLGPRATTRFILLNNGCDHLEPQPELPRLISYVNARLDGAEVAAGTFEDYVRMVRKEKPRLGTIGGELHEGRYHALLSGVFSSRVPLKQENEKTQALLEKVAEPLCALAWCFGLPYESDFLWHAWRLCLQNHPHDSICGCSADQVHREMLPRFEQSRQIASQLAEESAAHILGLANTTAADSAPSARSLLAFNPHGWQANEVACVQLSFPVAPDEEAGPLKVVDCEGKPVPSQICRRKIGPWREGFPPGASVSDLELCFQAKAVPAVGYKVYTFAPGSAETRATDLTVQDMAIENSYVRVVANLNGSVDILHKETGHWFRGCNVLEDSEDAGDEYDYSPAENGLTITSYGCSARVKTIECGRVRATIALEFDLEIPEELEEDRKTRSEERVVCPVSTEVSLMAGVPRVEFRTVFDNRARDHRLRALFPTGLRVEKAHAESAFCVVERNLDLPDCEGWSQKPVPTKAMRNFVDVSDGTAGLAVASSGLLEYEARKGENGAVVCLTLFRAVGWLSRPDGQCRPYNVGPTIPTPAAQCPGSQEFRYAAIAHGGTWEQGHVWEQAHFHRAPLVVFAGECSPGMLPRELGLAAVEPQGAVISSVKKWEDGDSLVVRLYNTTSRRMSAALKFWHEVSQVRLLNLDEEPIRGGRLSVVRGKLVRIPLRPYQIATIAAKLKQPKKAMARKARTVSAKAFPAQPKRR